MQIENILINLKKDNIIGSEGVIHFTLKDTSVIIEDISVVGNILQEWLAYYMYEKSINYRTKSNSQEFPDFLLHPTSDTKDLLEVKTFTKSPNFDVANFSAYVRSLRDHPYRLNAKYLIFKYELNKNTKSIKIQDIWLKNVWEICSASLRSPVKIQWKQGDPVNIRPATWYSDKANFSVFKTRYDFVNALSKVVGMSRIDSSIQKNWFKTVQDNYKQHTKMDL